MSTWAVETRELRKTFGKVVALNDLELHVAPGTVFGLLGPNGAGKTTAVRVLTTLLRPDSGAANVLGHDVQREPEVVRRNIGLASQYASVDENLTGEENLYLLGRLHLSSSTDARARSAQLLEQFELTEAGGRLARTYSGGMRRRLDLASALVNRPAVLFLDEPTTGLDPRSRIQLWESLRRLVHGGTTLLLTTQYLEEADRLADDIVVIDGGRAVAQGSARALKADLGATTLVLGLPSAREAVIAAELLQQIATRVEVMNSSVVLHVADGARALADSATRLDAGGLSAVSARIDEPSLDDVFLRLTGRAAA